MTKKFKIFLSCGQREGKEKKCGKQICKFFEKNYSDRVEILFAENTYTSAGLTNIIFKNLKECDAFIAILHKREPIKEREYRGSLFVNQELGIASFLGKKYYLVYSESNIKLEGVFKYIMNRTIDFSSPDNIVENLKPKIDEWLSIWKPPEPKLRFDDPKIDKFVERSKPTSFIYIPIIINNMTFNKIMDFEFGIVVPSEVRYNISQPQDDFENPNQILSGALEKYFYSRNKDDIFVSKYNGVIPRYGTFNRTIRLHLLEKLKLFQVGFYYFSEETDIEILSGRITIKSANKADIQIERGLNRYRIFQEIL